MFIERDYTITRPASVAENFLWNICSAAALPHVRAEEGQQKCQGHWFRSRADQYFSKELTVTKIYNGHFNGLTASNKHAWDMESIFGKGKRPGLLWGLPRLLSNA
jgi:hypothetical protein